MNRVQKLIISAMGLCFYNSEDGVSGTSVSDAPPEAPPETPVDAPAEAPPEAYIGNSTVNPDQRPLIKDFDTAGYSKDDIDSLLEEIGQEAFMSDEDIKKYNESKGEVGTDEKPAVDGVPEEKKAPDDNPTPEGKKDSDDDLLQNFYADSDITEDVFKTFPEKTQEKLLTAFVKTEAPESDEFSSLNDKYQTLIVDSQAQNNDPVIAARLQELKSGKQYVASELTAVSDQDLAEIDAAFDKGNDEVRTVLNKIISNKAKTAVGIERTVLDSITQEKKDNQSVWDKLVAIGAINKKLSLKETSYENFQKMGDKHPEHASFLGGANDVLSYLKEKKYTSEQVRSMDASEIYASYARSRGLDSDVFNNIKKNAVKELLKKINKPRTATLLKGGEKLSTPSRGTKSPLGIDRDALKKDMLQGNSKEYVRLLDIAISREDEGLINTLEELREDVFSQKSKQ